MTDITKPLIFVGVTPCRVADTRGNGFVGAYGPPGLVANMNRTFAITGQCGIPDGVSAVSFNFGALNVGGAGDLRVFPAGASAPLVSTMNYNASTPNIANAAVVPLGTGGGITVLDDAVSIDLIIDTNGYYTGGQGGPLNAGEALEIVGDPSPSSGLLFVHNKTTSAAASVSSVRGYIDGAPSGAGVHGLQVGAAGVNSGVRGSNYSSTGGAAGVFGEALSTTGLVNGVFGTTAGDVSNGAGVLGTTGFAFTKTFSTAGAGVRGEGRNGVVGVTSNTGESGVIGVSVTSAGGLGPYAHLATPLFAVYATGDYGGTGAKMFIEPHPTDASKSIHYVALEGPESGTYFRGTARVSHGQAVIPVPEDFRMVTDDDGLSVQLTPIGASASMWIVSEDLDQIVVRSSKDVAFHYLVNGVRRSFKDLQPIVEANDFMPMSSDTRMSEALAPLQRQRLIANGTYNADGTPNLATARALGWTRIWEDGARAAEPAVSRPIPSANGPD
jgi:hypothetical protein